MTLGLQCGKLAKGKFTDSFLQVLLHLRWVFQCVSYILLLILTPFSLF